MAHISLGIMNMHSKNILHRDIKTQNMFLTKDDVIKLGDFGIAKALGTQVDFAKTFLGTPYFMSPEVCKGN
jgi:NIMA (never in mitosis gene a)-related kinase